MPDDATPAPATTSASHPKILVAEDDQFLSKIYKSKLATENLNVFMAADGETALKLAKEHLPQLILLDLIMPKMNGFEVLQALQADPALQAIPVIVLSNLGQEGDVQKAKQLGAKDFVVKSNASIQEIVVMVKKILGNPSASQ